MSHLVGRQKGVLVSCDVPALEFIRFVHDTEPQGFPIVIAALDDQHVLIDPRAEAFVRRRLAEYTAQLHSERGLE